MEFNGINNETNGIDGFERRLSERASAIDYWLSENEINKSIGGRIEWEWNELLWNESKEGNEIKLILIDLMEWTSAAQWNKRNGTARQAKRGKWMEQSTTQTPSFINTKEKVLMKWMEIGWLRNDGREAKFV